MDDDDRMTLLDDERFERELTVSHLNGYHDEIVEGCPECNPDAEQAYQDRVADDNDGWLE